jgi:hypothetical protein
MFRRSGSASSSQPSAISVWHGAAGLSTALPVPSVTAFRRASFPGSIHASGFPDGCEIPLPALRISSFCSPLQEDCSSVGFDISPEASNRNPLLHIFAVEMARKLWEKRNLHHPSCKNLLSSLY